MHDRGAFRAAVVAAGVKLHPATRLAAWCAFAIVVQRLSLPQLALAVLLVLPLTITFARHRVRTLLWRARWLLLAIAVLFVAATPGERLPGLPGTLGLTRAGLDLAAEHLLRLVVMLASLAWLLEMLGRAGLLASLYCLLAPLEHGRRLRERIVVRLLLAIDEVENSAGRNWREWLNEAPAAAAPQSSLQLLVPPLRARDRILLVLLGVAATAVLGAA